MRVLFVCYLNVDESNGASLSFVFFDERSETERETMRKLWGVVTVGRERNREKRLLFPFLFSLEFDQNCPSLSFFVFLFCFSLASSSSPVGVVCVFVGERKAE